MATTQTVIAQNGPLPIKTVFDPLSDGPALIMVSGSVWSNKTDTMIGIQISLDGNVIGSTSIFANPSTVHMAVVPISISHKFTFGQHELTLTPANGNTIGDLNDYFQVTILY